MLLLYLLGVSACFVVSTVAHEAIFGGRLAARGQFPYQVSVQHYGVHFCGGGLIRSDAVLTAAHPFFDVRGHFDNLPLTVVAGTRNLNRIQPIAITSAVQKIFIPWDFNPRTRLSDIAVLKLSNNITAIRIFLSVQPRIRQYYNALALIAGWGYTYVNYTEDHREVGGRISSELRFATARFEIPDECTQSHAHHTRINNHRQICAKVEQRAGQRGACMFDNGGPLVIWDPPIVIGVLSRISPGCEEREVSGIYTRAGFYHVFIYQALIDQPNAHTHAYHLAHPRENHSP